MFEPAIDVLPHAQQALWPELSATPRAFTLYGGTAIALRLGHRFSVDFDFFSSEPFAPGELAASIAYLAGATLLQSAENTLTMLVERGGPVQMSYFGGLGIGQVAPHEPVAGPEFAVASLLDMAGMKVAMVTQRAEMKDYRDIHALLVQAGIGLPVMLSAAAVIYGSEFNPVIALKAISYFSDPALAALPKGIKSDLATAVRSVDVKSLPVLSALRRKRLRP